MEGEANNHVVQHPPPPQQPTAAAALTSLPGAFHTSGGAEAEQDGCVLGS